MEHNIGDDQHAAADFREAARLRPDWASFLHPGWMDRVTAASTTYVSSTLNTTSPSSSAAAVQPRDAPPSVSTSTAAIPGSSAPQIEAESGSLIGTFGFDEAGMDRSVAPGDDFYEFANGGWLRRIDIPENKAVYGMFTLLDDLSSRRSRQILEDAEKDPQSKVGNAYAAFLDMRTIEAKGLGPIQPWLNHIRAVQSKSEYASVAAEAARNGVGGPIGAFVSQDDKDSSEYALEIVQAGLGLPDRDYYLLDSAKVIAVRTAYLTHLEHVLTLAGETGVASRARAVLDYETQIARVHWSRADTHDNDKTYNKISVAELVAQSPGFDFRAYLRGIGAQVQSVIVGEPSAVTGIAAGVANAPLEVLKDQLIVRSLDRYASVLPKAIDDENFKFYGTVLSATPQQDERWKRAVNATTRMLSDDLAKIYVRDFFPPSAKTAADQLVENLAGAMARRIDAVTWMLPATKASAHAKLRAVRFKIGYPTHWRDFSGLEIRRDDAFGNALRSSRFEHEFNISKLGKPTYRWEWGITPMTINGYANFGDLSVVFPVAILQPPFFDPAADPAVNYGGIGVVIAHELSHHFDDQGAKYDVKGDLNNWWTPNDAAAFNSEAEKLQRQFDAYEPVPGIHISGKMTSGENVADLAGLEIALDAYHASLGGRTAPVIDGFTGDQRFYLAWAQIWRQKYRDSTLRQRLLTDPHAPSEQRVDVVRNLAPWYDAFDVKPGQKLYLAPEERVTVW
jgi:putative endopeptidase